VQHTIYEIWLEGGSNGIKKSFVLARQNASHKNVLL
jgi:hypothetical protein